MPTQSYALTNLKRMILLLPLLLVFLFAFVAFSGSKASRGKAAGVRADDKFIGTETCRQCHEDEFQKFKATKMGKIMTNPKTPLEARGCESCHGPGRAHAEAGGDVSQIIRFGQHSNMPKDVQEAQCQQCHEKGNRMFWKGSPHASRGIGCVDCHQVMTRKEIRLSSENRFKAPLGDVTELKRQQPELCLQCHQMRRAQLQRSSHMPFREGKVTCTSCHNPHGTPNPKQLIQATPNENCYSCHAERRGPFLWEHPPVVENCGNCHEAHGSTNPQLLKARAPKLCQECHNDGQHRSTAYANVMPSTGNGTPAGYNNRVLNRGCANCHSRVHGSNHPSGNYFTR